MSWVAAAVGGAAIVGGVLQSNAANSAAQTQADAANNANQLQWNMYQQQREDYAPWRQSGTKALSSLNSNDFMNNWQSDPGYEFRLNEGNKAINNAASARGMASSGATMKALTSYGSNLASQEYDKVYNRQYNRLTALAGLGSNATNATSNSAYNYANSTSNNLMSAANANSAAQMANANAWSSGLNNTANTYMMSQLIKK